MTHIVCLGIATDDLILRVDELPTGDGKWSARSLVRTGGGVAANAAVTICRLGGRATLIGERGDDPRGTDIEHGLAVEGVVPRLHRVAGAESPLSTIFVDGGGDRTIVNYADPGLFTETRCPDLVPLDDADGLLVDTRWPHGAIAALAAARDHRIVGVVDFDRPLPQQGEDILRLASHVVFSRDALLATVEDPDPESALLSLQESRDTWLGVTLGADGVVWIDDGRPRHMAAPVVDAIDTLGAGDVFHGAFALALAEGADEWDGIRFAMETAAVKCSRPGGRLGIPHRHDVDAFRAAREVGIR